AANTNTDPLEAPGFATNTPPEHPRPGVTCGTKRKNTGGERGIRTLEGLLTLTPLAGVRLRPLGHLSVLGKMLAAQMLTRGSPPPAKKGAHDTSSRQRLLGASLRLGPAGPRHARPKSLPAILCSAQPCASALRARAMRSTAHSYGQPIREHSPH